MLSDTQVNNSYLFSLHSIPAQAGSCSSVCWDFLITNPSLNTNQPAAKGWVKKWAGFDRQRPISPKGAGIQNS